MYAVPESIHIGVRPEFICSPSINLELETAGPTGIHGAPAIGGQRVPRSITTAWRRIPQRTIFDKSPSEAMIIGKQFAEKRTDGRDGENMITGEGDNGVIVFDDGSCAAIII